MTQNQDSDGKKSIRVMIRGCCSWTSCLWQFAGNNKLFQVQKWEWSRRSVRMSNRCKGASLFSITILMLNQLCWWHMIDVALLRLQLGLCVMYSENGSTKVGLRLGESSPSAQQVQWSELWTYIHIILFIKCQHLLEYLKDLLFAAASGWFQALRRCDC